MGTAHISAGSTHSSSGGVHIHVSRFIRLSGPGHSPTEYYAVYSLAVPHSLQSAIVCTHHNDKPGFPCSDTLYTFPPLPQRSYF